MVKFNDHLVELNLFVTTDVVVCQDSTDRNAGCIKDFLPLRNSSFAECHIHPVTKKFGMFHPRSIGR